MKHRKSISRKVAEQIRKDRQHMNALGSKKNREAWLRKAKARGVLDTFGVVGEEGEKNASI